MVRAMAALLALVSCAAPPPPPPPPKPVVVGPPTDTLRIPLTDLGARTYFGHQGGLYPGGVNLMPGVHDSVVRARRNTIKPLDVNGDESPFGRYVLLSIGGSTATEVWCSATSGPPCAAWSVMGKAAADPGINRSLLVIVNGAADSLDASTWTSPASPNYERIKVARLNPLGLTENQVQAIWLNVEGTHTGPILPSDSAEVYRSLTNVAQVARTLKIRYPMLQLLFVSSPIYGGYAPPDSSHEPYNYEAGFAVKWAIESQIAEMRNEQPNPLAGTLNYVKKAAPVMVWGPYLWASDSTARSDGFRWDRIDFEQNGVRPSQTGEAKMATILLEFFKTSLYTRCWFLIGQYCF